MQRHIKDVCCRFAKLGYFVPTKNVFGALSAAFYHNMLSDLAFELSNPTINVYAHEVLLVALGWKSYDTYLAEMRSLLIGEERADA